MGNIINKNKIVPSSSVEYDNDNKKLIEDIKNKFRLESSKKPSFNKPSSFTDLWSEFEGYERKNIIEMYKIKNNIPPPIEKLDKLFEIAKQELKLDGKSKRRRSISKKSKSKKNKRSNKK
jgi:hypothetical protein